MTRTIPSPHPVSAPGSPVATSATLTLALAGLPGWDPRVGRLDRSMTDLLELVEPEPESIRP